MFVLICVLMENAKTIGPQGGCMFEGGNAVCQEVGWHGDTSSYWALVA